MNLHLTQRDHKLKTAGSEADPAVFSVIGILYTGL